MLPQVRLLDEMDEQMWVLLHRNLAGLTEGEAGWRTVVIDAVKRILALAAAPPR